MSPWCDVNGFPLLAFHRWISKSMFHNCNNGDILYLTKCIIMKYNQRIGSHPLLIRFDRFRFEIMEFKLYIFYSYCVKWPEWMCSPIFFRFIYIAIIEIFAYPSIVDIWGENLNIHIQSLTYDWLCYINRTLKSLIYICGIIDLCTILLFSLNFSL